MPIVSRRRDDDSSAADPDTTADGDRSSGGWLGKALLGLGLLAVAAVAVRRLDGLPTSVGESPQSAPDSTSETDAVSVDVQSPDGTRTSTGGGESGPDIETIDEETDEAMAERSVEDIQETPAEPGEMTVDDDVVDEVTDEDEDATGGASDDETDDDRE